jgi:hypothetical protein
MIKSKRPVTGYLLIKTETVDGNTEASKDDCDGIYEDPLERIACKIHGILRENKWEKSGDVEGPFRGAIVKSDEPQLNIIVSFRAKDEDTFNAIADQIRSLSAPAKSKEEVTGVTVAVSIGVPDGFQGPP